LIIALSLLAASAAAADDGEYLLRAAGCVACHTPEGGKPLAGGRAFDTPFGVFHSPNITPHPTHGIGGWSREDFVNAVRHGQAPDGSRYFPVFPYPSYQRMTDADAGAIYDHLMQREPVDQANRPHELAGWLGRWMMRPWQWWYLPRPERTLQPQDPVLARGQYLVDALGHCTECHTPRNFAGVSDAARYLGGTREGPEGSAVPNITPHREDGIGKWSQDDIAWFLEIGELPDGDYTGGAMADVIDESTVHLTADDRRAMAAYLRSIPPLPGP
jgi:mono/diheme cytochrome c family protein